MKNEQLKKTKDDLEKTIEDCAAKLADPASTLEAKVEKDISFIMLAATETLWHLPESDDTEVHIDKSLLRQYIDRLADCVVVSDDDENDFRVDKLEVLWELATEFDDQLASRLKGLKSNIEATGKPLAPVPVVPIEESEEAGGAYTSVPCHEPTPEGPCAKGKGHEGSHDAMIGKLMDHVKCKTPTPSGECVLVKEHPGEHKSAERLEVESEKDE